MTKRELYGDNADAGMLAPPKSEEVTRAQP